MLEARAANVGKEENTDMLVGQKGPWTFILYV